MVSKTMRSTKLNVSRQFCHVEDESSCGIVSERSTDIHTVSQSERFDGQTHSRRNRKRICSTDRSGKVEVGFGGNSTQYNIVHQEEDGAW